MQRKEWMLGSASNVCRQEDLEGGSKELGDSGWPVYLDFAAAGGPGLSDNTSVSLFDAVPNQSPVSIQIPVVPLNPADFLYLSPHTGRPHVTTLQPHWSDSSPEPLACPPCHHCLCPTLTVLLMTSFFKVSETLISMCMTQ